MTAVTPVTGTLEPLQPAAVDAKVLVQMADAWSTPKSLMPKSIRVRVFKPVAILALLWTPLALLTAQQSLASPRQIGPFPAAEALASSDLPSAPDPAIAVHQPITGEMFAVRPVEVPAPHHEQHRFWDRENRTLFAASAGGATADFFVTRSNLARGGRELNPVTRIFAGSSASLAANFALETSSVVGISYFFHKTGHHKLERATSFVNISSSAGAVIYGLTHR